MATEKLTKSKPDKNEKKEKPEKTEKEKKEKKNKEKGGGHEETERHGRLPLGILFSQQQFGLP